MTTTFVGFSVQRASALASSAYNNALREANIDATDRQVAVLMALDNNTSETNMSQTDLSADTGIDRSTLADLVRRLLSRGYIKRERSKIDQRVYEVQLTANGRKLLDRAMKRLEKIDAGWGTAGGELAIKARKFVQHDMSDKDRAVAPAPVAQKGKPVAKPATKPSVKAPTKPVAKPTAVKSPPKATVAKPVAKPATKTVTAQQQAQPTSELAD